MKICVITAEFNHDERIYSPSFSAQDTNHEVEFIALNNNNYPTRNLSLHPRLKSKIPKFLQWKITEADYYIWFDSKFKVTSSKFVDWHLKEIGSHDLCLFEHPERSTIKEELDFMQEMMSDNNQYLNERYIGEPMKEQVEHYLAHPNFSDNSLFSCGMFIYSKNLVLNKDYNLMTDWLLECTYWSVQDQLSIPFLLQKHKVNYNTYDYHILKNRYTIYG